MARRSKDASLGSKVATRVRRLIPRLSRSRALIVHSGRQCSTYAIESLKNAIRKFTRNRKIYPNDQSALKLVYMAIREAARRWTMPIHHWKQALNHFAVLYEDRMPELTTQ